MKITVLGCSGGIGQPATTTSYLVDDDILIDAGTGLSSLGLAAMTRIDHVFLTHSHLDHIASLPLMADSVGSQRDRPVRVYAHAETIAVLREHVFNGKVWPDFTVIPSAKAPFLTLREIAPGEEVRIGARRIRGVEMTHTVPAMGYFVSTDTAAFAFSGDTTETGAFWDQANSIPDLQMLVIETTFPDAQRELARIAGHLCPEMLARQLRKYRGTAAIYLTHLMPGAEDRIMSEVRRHIPVNTPARLVRDQVFEL